MPFAEQPGPDRGAAGGALNGAVFISHASSEVEESLSWQHKKRENATDRLGFVPKATAAGEALTG